MSRYDRYIERLARRGVRRRSLLLDDATWRRLGLAARSRRVSRSRIVADLVSGLGPESVESERATGSPRPASTASRDVGVREEQGEERGSGRWV